MIDKKDGGQAFPHGDPTNGGDIGMTLRDYFAAKELTSLEKKTVCVCDRPREYARIADHCYRMADAMLAERAKDQP